MYYLVHIKIATSFVRPAGGGRWNMSSVAWRLSSPLSFFTAGVVWAMLSFFLIRDRLSSSSEEHFEITSKEQPGAPRHSHTSRRRKCFPTDAERGSSIIEVEWNKKCSWRRCRTLSRETRLEYLPSSSSIFKSKGKYQIPNTRNQDMYP
jgi:hypothetical protein